MHVKAIRSGNAPTRGPYFALTSLIESVGRPGFSETLFRAARTATGCDHLTVFTGRCGRIPQTSLIEGLDSPKWLYESNRKYSSGHWRVDPIRRMELDLGSSDVSLISLDRHDLSNSTYRNDCFTSVKLYSRASILSVRDNERIQFNLYFSDRSAFDPSVCQYLCESAELYDILLRRHVQEGGRNVIRLTKPDAMSRLRVAAPVLTQRELEVCAGIACGLSSEGIGIELDISLNTVLTYRKRAYARLRISTQNELMQLLMAPSH